MIDIDRYLYEIIDDYKHAESNEDKTEIFNDFCSFIWSNKNKRRLYTKQIKFKVRDDLLETDIGQIFNTWSEVEYTGYKVMTKNNDWRSLLRQKINNLYTKYFDKEVILKSDYMNLLKTPRNLYYRWIDGEDMNPEELTAIIEESIYKAAELKLIYQKQKMKISWDMYKILIEGFLRKIFDNCRLIDEYEEENLTDKYIHNFCVEDNFYISYICKSIESYMLNYQKEYYGLKRGRNKKYKHCEKCGYLIEDTHNRKKYCSDCKRIMELERYKKYNKKRTNHN